MTAYMFCIGRTKLQRIHALMHRRLPVLCWPHRVDFRVSMHWTGCATPISKACHRICEPRLPATPKHFSENPCAALQYPKVPCRGAMAWLVGINNFQVLAGLLPPIVLFQLLLHYHVSQTRRSLNVFKTTHFERHLSDLFGILRSHAILQQVLQPAFSQTSLRSWCL